MRQWLFISIISSCSCCSLCVYYDCNNGFYCYFLCNPFSLPSIKNKNLGEEKKKPSTEEYTKITHIFEGVLVDVLSLTCVFNLFPRLCFLILPEGNSWKRESKWALLKQRIKAQLFSHLEQLLLNLTLDYNHPKNLKNNNNNNKKLCSSPTHSDHISLLKFYDSIVF